jgi:hypothetical protein
MNLEKCINLHIRGAHRIRWLEIQKPFLSNLRIDTHRFPDTSSTCKSFKLPISTGRCTTLLSRNDKTPRFAHSPISWGISQIRFRSTFKFDKFTRLPIVRGSSWKGKVSQGLRSSKIKIQKMHFFLENRWITKLMVDKNVTCSGKRRRKSHIEKGRKRGKSDHVWLPWVGSNILEATIVA